MAVEVILPKIDEAMIEGRIAEWQKKEGDWVEKGEVLYLVDTEKVTWEVEAPESGILSKVRFKAGDVVKVATIVAFILQPGEEAPQVPVDAKLEMKKGVATTTELAVTKARAAEEAMAIRASPLAKRIAKEYNIDLSQVKGTGPEGRITKEDVTQAIGKTEKVAMAPQLQEEVIPLSSMRRTIAQRLTESFQSAPHFYLLVEVDVEELNQLREKLMPDIERLTGARLTYTDLLLKITGQALAEHPEVNVTWVSNGIKRLPDVNLGLAIAVEEGLVVPVIRQANTKSLVEITLARVDFVERAAQGKIMSGEMRGSSITLTNLGMFGIDQFSPIINPPESCILGIGRIVDKPVAHNGEVVIRPRMNLTLAIDHRVLDGASGGRFLQRIKELIEQPIQMIATKQIY